MLNTIHKIKLWHFILFVLVCIALVQLSEIIDSVKLLFLFIDLSFKHDNFFSDQMTFSVFDQFQSLLMLIILPLILILLRNKLTIFSSQVNVSTAIITIFILFFIFAPLISPFNSNMQFNLSVTKNLSPFSSRTLVSITEKEESAGTYQEYILLRNSIFREVVDKNYFIQKNSDMNFSLNTYPSNRVEISTVYFLFGTDEFGRDLFSRMVYAVRLSLFIGLTAVLITVFIGLFLGFISGYFHNYLDIILNRVTEVFLAIPSIFMVILFLALWGNSLINLIIVLGISSWMSLFKIVRGEVKSLKTKNYVISSKMLGLKGIKILFKDFIPLLIPSIIINIFFQFANVIIAESSLSFLGLTGDHFYPTLGSIIDEGIYYLNSAWWITFFPSLFLILILFVAYKLGRKFQAKYNPFIEAV